MQKKYNFNAFL